MTDPNLQPQSSAPDPVTTDRYADLLREKVGPVTDLVTETEAARNEATQALRVFYDMISADARKVGRSAAATIETLIAEIDARLTAQINEILHHPAFQKLEGSWRGFHRLVAKTESGPELKIKFMSMGKAELQEHLDEYPDSRWDQSAVFEKLYGPYDRIGADPYGCIVGDYQFDHSVGDVRLMSQMARIASAAHAPFIAGASSRIMGFPEDRGAWQLLEQVSPTDIPGRFESDEYAPWRDFRKSEDARYVGLALPKFLARTAWGTGGEPVKQFAFEEFGSAKPADYADHNNYVWSNAAYAMATNITRAFKECGWCSRIRGVKSGGLVEDLPVYTYSAQGGKKMTCPTELSMGDRRELELAKAGFMPLEHIEKTSNALFKGAQSTQLPKEFDDDDATANAALGARLPYLFAASRFAHYLKVMVREGIGDNTSSDKLKSWLSSWVSNYVLNDPDNASPENFAERPLLAAEVEVKPIPGSPGAYEASFKIQPHYQLEKVDITLSLSSTLKPGQ